MGDLIDTWIGFAGGRQSEVVMQRLAAAPKRNEKGSEHTPKPTAPTGDSHHSLRHGVVWWCGMGVGVGVGVGVWVWV